MIAAALPRRIATVLLQSAISIAPQEALEWGHAMLSELRHVEGNWPALFWSLGSAGVLAKHALVALIFPSRNRSRVPTGGDLFSKEGSMRKPALAVIASCVLASLLFFLAPVFRQAFSISQLQWHGLVHVTTRLFPPDYVPPNLLREAERNHDAEAIAFVAVRGPDQSESVRLSEEAVHLDPKLTWVYAIVALEHLEFPKLNQWVPELEKYDPQNALPHLIAAERLDIDQVEQGKVPRKPEEEPDAWKNDMFAAFQSAKLDEYRGQWSELDRRVLLRYHIEDPFLVARGESELDLVLPSYAAWDSARYGKLLLASAQTLASQGDSRGALQKYLTVVHFCTMIKRPLDPWNPANLEAAYVGLASLSAKQGRSDEATFYQSVAEQSRTTHEKELDAWRSEFRRPQASLWNALLAKIAGATLLVWTILFLFSVIAVLKRSRSLRPSFLHPTRLEGTTALASSVLLLFSSVTLYAAYHPYAQVVQHFLQTGDTSQLADLQTFLDDARFPPGIRTPYLQKEFVFYFWCAALALCVLALLFMLLRYVRSRSRVSAAA